MIALVLLVLLAILEGDLGEEFGELGVAAAVAVTRYGAPASLALLYLEESGVPLPVPGDAMVTYLGGLSAGSWPRWVAAWLAVIAVVVAGSSNLYLVSRRWGQRLVAHRLSHAIHLDRDRLDRVELWFSRWGAFAVIFGRHIPGFRVPITVMAGVFEVKYRVFAPSVAVSTAFWAAFWLWLGARFGGSVAHVLRGNHWLYGVGIGLMLAAVAYIVFRAWRGPRTE